MDNYPESFTPEESLRVIQTMIEKTKTTVADNSFYFLLWGWLVFIGAVGQYILAEIVRTEWNPVVWSLMIFGVIVSAVHGMRQRKTHNVKTYVDEGLRNIWTSIGVVQTLIVFTFMRRG